MIGIDTNILVRYLVGDDPRQAMLAADLLERRISGDQPAFVSTVVMAEVAWVLERVYRVSGAALASALEQVYGSEGLVFEHDWEVGQAIALLADGQGSFADALIGAVALKHGCTHTATFDRKALRLPGFEPV